MSEKNTYNQDKYTGEDDLQSPVGFRRAVMKQLERIENVLVAILDNVESKQEPTIVNDVIQEIQDTPGAILDDILDDGKLNKSNRGRKKKKV